MSKEHVVKSMSALFSISTLDWRRMCGFFFAHSGFQPAAPLPRNRTRMPDSVETGGSATGAAALGFAVVQPASAASAVDETRKFLRERLFFMSECPQENPFTPKQLDLQHLREVRKAAARGTAEAVYHKSVLQANACHAAFLFESGSDAAGLTAGAAVPGRTTM